MNAENDHTYMQAALEEARLAESRDEVPIGAVIVDPKSGEIVARSGNRTIELADPTAHAEIQVIRETCKIAGKQRIPEYDLYVTLEPCTMCAAAIAFARIRRLVYAAPDEKGGAVESGVKFFNQPTCHHKIEVTSGIESDVSAEILRTYFRKKR